METFQILIIKSQEKLKIADHLIDTTYALVKEPKLLVSVITHMYESLEFSMAALLEYEKKFKPIPFYNETFEQRIDIFKRKIATKYDIKDEVINFITDLKKTVDKHQKSSVEFTKKESFVISDNDYNMILLNVDEVKKKLLQAKKYVNMMLSNITND